MLKSCYLCNQAINKTTKDKRKAAGPGPNNLSSNYGKGTAVFPKKQTIMKKNRISDILGVLCILTIFSGIVEAPDGGITLWTVLCLPVAAIFGILSKYTEKQEDAE